MLSQDAYQTAYHRFRVKLRQARLDARLTQGQVAQQLGRPQSFVSKIEAGERRVDFVELQNLTRLFDKPLSFFLDSEQER